MKILTLIGKAGAWVVSLLMIINLLLAIYSYIWEFPIITVNIHILATLFLIDLYLITLIIMRRKDIIYKAHISSSKFFEFFSFFFFLFITLSMFSMIDCFFFRVNYNNAVGSLLSLNIGLGTFFLYCKLYQPFGANMVIFTKEGVQRVKLYNLELVVAILSSSKKIWEESSDIIDSTITIKNPVASIKDPVFQRLFGKQIIEKSDKGIHFNLVDIFSNNFYQGYFLKVGLIGNKALILYLYYI